MSSGDTPSTYQRYKESTETFITWLSRTAKSCGWNPKLRTVPDKAKAKEPRIEEARIKGPRIKGKARKAAKEAAKEAAVNTKDTSVNPNHNTPLYTITTKQLLNQIDIVAKSNKISHLMPQDIHNALITAIKKRKEANAWFEETEFLDQASMEGHRYFIGLLQQAMDKLPKESERDNPNATNSKANVSSGDKKNAKSGTTSTRNTFETLDVEDVLEEDEAPEQETTQPHPPNRTARTTEANDIYQLEVDPQTELPLMVYFYFQDLHQLRDELKNDWTQFYDGRMPLVAATILTLKCLEMARQAEAQVHEFRASVNKGSRQTYEDLSGMARKEDSLEITALSEFLLLPAGRILFKLAKNVSLEDKLTLKAKSLDADFWHIPRARAEYQNLRPDLLDDPRIKEFEKQDEFTCQVVMDMMLDDVETRINGVSKSTPKPGYSVIFAVFRPLWTERIVTTTMVFAAQVLWDIHNLDSSEKISVLTVMNSAAEELQNSFKFTQDDQTPVYAYGLPVDDNNKDRVTEIFTRMEFHVKKQPSVPRIKKFFYSKDGQQGEQGDLSTDLPIQAVKFLNPLRHRWTEAKQHADDFIKPNEDMSFLIKANPIYAGTILMDVTSRAEEVGINLTNINLAIALISHLYNAMAKLGLLYKTRWPEMEEVMEIQAKPIFAGDVPSSSEECKQRFDFRMEDVTHERQIRRQQKRWELQPNSTNSALRKFFGSEITLPQLMHTLTDQAEAHEAASRGGNKTSYQKGQYTAKGYKRLPLETLSTLRKHIKAEIPLMEVDYVMLMRRCLSVHADIKYRVLIEIDGRSPSGLVNDNSDRRMDIGFILDEAHVCMEMARKIAEITKKEPPSIEDLMAKYGRRVLIARQCLVASIAKWSSAEAYAERRSASEARERGITTSRHQIHLENIAATLGRQIAASSATGTSSSGINVPTVQSHMDQMTAFLEGRYATSSAMGTSPSGNTPTGYPSLESAVEETGTYEEVEEVEEE